MEDEQIVALFFTRSEEAIAELSRKYGRWCQSVAFGILRNREDAEECVNDAYRLTWDSIPPNRPESLAAYVGKIVRNASVDRWRENRASKRGGGASAVEMVVEELAECLPGEDGSRMADDMLLRDVLNRFLNGLAEEKAVIFVRRYWYAMEIREIAAAHGMREGQVTMILARLRKKLKKQLESEGISL